MSNTASSRWADFAIGESAMPIELVPNHLHCSVNKIGIIYLVTIDSFDWDELAPKLGMFSINYVEELGIPKDKVTEARTIFFG